MKDGQLVLPVVQDGQYHPRTVAGQNVLVEVDGAKLLSGSVGKVAENGGRVVKRCSGGIRVRLLRVAQEPPPW